MKAGFFKKMITAVFAAVCCILWCGALVSAANEGSIKYCYIKNNVQIRIYKVAANINRLEGDFAAYSVSLTDENAAKTLAAYALSDNIAPYASKTTDTSNEAYFTDLPKGYYLISGDSHTSGKTKYTIMPVIAAVDNNELVVTGKYETETVPGGDTPQGKQLGVMKVWSGSDGESQAVAELIKDGAVYDRVTLNQENNWRHTWTGLDSGSNWTVVEKDVDPKYQVSIDKDGDVYIIVNSYTPDTPEEPTETTTTQPTTRKPSGGGSVVKPKENSTEAATEITTSNIETTTAAEKSTEGTTAAPAVPNEPSNPDEPDNNNPGNGDDVIEEPTVPSEESGPEPGMMGGRAPRIAGSDKPSKNSETGNAPHLGNPARPSRSGSDKLPQTGQPWLPVPILAFTGILFVIFGLAERQMEV